MDEEEQFVNIDLNDDNICSVCKLETETGTMSFCHVCFELSIEGVSSAALLHSKSLRGHRDCFEKCHLIANQKLSHSKVSRSSYEGMKLALGQKLSRIIHFAQNKDSSNSCSRRGSKLLCYSQQNDCKLLPQTDAQVPRYAPCWDRGKATGLPEYTMGMLGSQTEEVELLNASQSDTWSGVGRGGLHGRRLSPGGPVQLRHQGHSREEPYVDNIMELVFGKVFPEPSLDEVEKINIPPTLSSQYSDYGGFCLRLPLQPRTGLRPTYCPRNSCHIIEDNTG